METVEQLKTDFMAQGYKEQSAQIHAECKYKANIYFDVSIKNKRRFISPVLHNIEQHTASEAKKIKSFYKKGGQVHYLQPKGTRKVYVKVAIPATTQTGIRPAHKLTPEQAFNLDAVKMFGKY
jgi:hypothetical protein